MSNTLEYAHQGDAPERLTFAYFLRELQHYLHLDKGLPHTIVDLVRRPGPMLRGYFAGTGRSGYSNPIAYSLMASAASLLAYSLYREPFTQWMRARLARTATTTQHEAVPQLAAFMGDYSENMFRATQHVAFNSITMAIPNALLLWLLFRGPRFNLAEAFAFALYAIGTFLFLHALVVAPVLYFSHAWSVGQYAGLGMQLGIALWLGLALFGYRLANLLKLSVAFAASFAIWVIAFAVCVAVYTALGR